MRKINCFFVFIFFVLGFSACGNIISRTVNARQYQMIRSEKCLVLDIDLITQEPLLNIEDLYGKNRRHVRVELAGEGVEELGGWRKYDYPGNISIKPSGYYGHAGYALVSPDRSEIRLRLHWKLKSGRVHDSEISGDYKLNGHEEMPTGLIVVEPAQYLFWKIGDSFEEKMITVRLGSPGELKIVKMRPEDSPIKIRMVPSNDRRTWKLFLQPDSDGRDDRSHLFIDICALVDGEGRHIYIQATVR